MLTVQRRRTHRSPGWPFARLADQLCHRRDWSVICGDDAGWTPLSRDPSCRHCAASSTKSAQSRSAVHPVGAAPALWSAGTRLRPCSPTRLWRRCGTQCGTWRPAPDHRGARRGGAAHEGTGRRRDGGTAGGSDSPGAAVAQRPPATVVPQARDGSRHRQPHDDQAARPGVEAPCHPLVRSM